MSNVTWVIYIFEKLFELHEGASKEHFVEEENRIHWMKNIFNYKLLGGEKLFNDEVFDPLSLVFDDGIEATQIKVRLSDL